MARICAYVSCLGVLASAQDWQAKRRGLLESIWDSGTLPTRSDPDAIHPTNTTGVSKLEWNVSGSFFPLTSTVFHSVRGDGTRGSNTAIIHHHGHAHGCDVTPPESRCDGPLAFFDFYNVTDFYHNGLGFDFFTLYMPLYPPNDQHGYPADHQWFNQWEEKGDKTIRYFVEPVVLTINYARSLGYEKIYMIGKSGGGWTTTLMAALDPRIEFSVPIAGSIPLEFSHKSWDYEQKPQSEDDSIRVKSKSNMCLDSQSVDMKEGDLIQLYPCKKSPNQEFDYARDDGTIRLKSKSQMCFHVQSAELELGALIQLSPCTASTNEQFEIRLSDNSIRMKAKPDICVESISHDLKEHDLLRLASCTGAANQQFVFGGLPWYLEQCDYKCLYALGVVPSASGNEARTSMQLLHEDDPCCYYGRGRHDGILAYDQSVMESVAGIAGDGVFTTAITDWNVHAICKMDRVLIKSALNSTALDRLPCDILRASDVPCPVPSHSEEFVKATGFLAASMV